MLASLLVLAAPQDEALETMKAVLKTYESAASCRMRIVHHDSSGLYPGDFEQMLECKGKRFVLKVTAPNKAGGDQERHAPDFHCDGKNVFRLKNGELDYDPFEYPAGTMPGWEVCGGLPLMAMLKSPNYATLWQPPPGFGKLVFRGPDTTEWMGQPVRRVKMLLDAGDGALREMASFILHSELPLLAGVAGPKESGGIGYAQYLDQEFDVDLPATLGDPP